MIITQEAAISARTGIATYTAREEDRQVHWTLSTRDLEEMAVWDALDEDERRQQVLAWLEGGPAPDIPPSKGTVSDPGYHASHTSWLELHGIVARNSLRRFLGSQA